MSIIEEKGLYKSTDQDIFRYHYGDPNFMLSVQTLSERVYNPKYLHSHEDYQFFFPSTEMPGISVGGRVFTGRPGMVYFIKSMIPHGMTYDLVGVAYSRILVKKVFFEELVYALPNICMRDVPDFVEMKESDDVKQLVAMYRKEYRYGELRSDGIQKALSTTIISMLIRQFLSPSGSMNQKADSGIKIQEICRYLTENCEKNITIDNLAQQFNISKYYLIRKFDTNKYQTPMAFLASVRINKAKNYLQYSEFPIAEIATKCGFSSLDYFSKAFKKATGTSPSKYRENIASGKVGE